MGRAVKDRFRVLFSNIADGLSKNDNSCKLADKDDEKHIFNV